MMRGQTPRIFGDGTKTRDYVFVDDVISAFMAAFDRLDRESVDDFYNVGTGVETDDRQVFESVLGCVRELSRRADYSRHLSVSGQVMHPEYAPLRPGEVRRSVLDVAKIQRVFGWRAQITFAEGVRQTVEAGCRASVASLPHKVA